MDACDGFEQMILLSVAAFVISHARTKHARTIRTAALRDGTTKHRHRDLPGETRKRDTSRHGRQARTPHWKCGSVSSLSRRPSRRQRRGACCCTAHDHSHLLFRRPSRGNVTAIRARATCRPTQGLFRRPTRRPVSAIAARRPCLSSWPGPGFPDGERRRHVAGPGGIGSWVGPSVPAGHVFGAITASALLVECWTAPAN